MARNSRNSPQSSEKQLSDTIEAVYQVGLDRKNFRNALSRIDNLIGGGFTFFVRVNVRDVSQMPIIEGSRDAGRGWDDYLNTYGRIDPKIPRFHRSAVHDVTVDYDYITEREIERHPFYQEFLADQGLRYSVNVKTWGRHDEVCVLGVQRDCSYGHVDRREVDLLRMLGRHMSQATEINRRFALGSATESSLVSAFDQVPEAIFLLRRDASILQANRHGAAMLREADGLAAQRGRLIASLNGCSKALHDAIASAGGPFPATTGGKTLSLPRPSGKRPLQALIMPMPRSSAPILIGHNPNDAAVLMVLSDPESLPTPCADRLAILFGLTPTESRFAVSLASGVTVNEYVELASITENTARWLLKRLREKTECRRQSDMVRRLATAAATWPGA